MADFGARPANGRRRFKHRRDAAGAGSRYDVDSLSFTKALRLEAEWQGRGSIQSRDRRMDLAASAWYLNVLADRAGRPTRLRCSMRLWTSSHVRRSSLTPTEMEVVRHVVQGLSNPRNRRADVHHPWSVKTHLAHIFAKLGTASRAELAAEAAKRGIGV